MFKLYQGRGMLCTACFQVMPVTRTLADRRLFRPGHIVKPASRTLHSTAPVSKKSFEQMIEQMGIVSSFKYEIVMPEDNSKPKIKFKDVGGQYEAKVELREIVDFLENRKRYTDLGAKIPSGALISGPPGNGKTLLARAIAGEASVPFINTAGPQFIEKVGGLGPKRVRELFAKCRELAPCILFIDEIDAVAKKRYSGGGASGGPTSGGGSSEANNIVNQFLVEMDGIDNRDEIFVIGATNRDDVLDIAITRPGRLDRKVFIDNPTELERKEVFRIHMAAIKLDKSGLEEYVERLAQCTPGYSGADIANICNEAAIHAARLAKSEVTKADFEHSMERVTAGLERKHPSITKEEMRLSAYYVAAQALVSWILPSLTPVLKMSISARVNNPLGFVQFAPRKDLLATKDHLLDLLCRGAAGKASQILFFQEHTDQARKDLKRITDVAYTMIADHGMGASAPNMSFIEVRQNEGRRYNLWSNNLQHEMDAEVRSIVQEQYDKAFKMLENNKDLLEILSEKLFSEKTLNEDEVSALMEKHGVVKYV